MLKFFGPWFCHSPMVLGLGEDFFGLLPFCLPDQVFSAASLTFLLFQCPFYVPALLSTRFSVLFLVRQTTVNVLVP